MLINILWLLIILSFEATLGLPLFFLYLSDRLLSRYSERVALFGYFAVSLLLAIFYGLSWPSLSAALLFWYLVKTFLSGRRIWLLLSYVLWQVGFFFMAALSWHYFYLIHILIFFCYLAKNNLLFISEKV